MTQTHGPWTVVDNYIWNEDLSTVIAEANTAANARLIAAVPDLLEACENEVIELANLAMMIDPEATKQYMKSVYAAIARAKGEA